jgi:hypothetical protein
MRQLDNIKMDTSSIVLNEQTETEHNWLNNNEQIRNNRPSITSGSRNTMANNDKGPYQGIRKIN